MAKIQSSFFKTKKVNSYNQKNFTCITINFTLNLLLVKPLNFCVMGKSKDKENKEVKKPATKSLKEKRLEKKEKKAGKV